MLLFFPFEILMEMNNANQPINPIETPSQPIQYPVNNQQSNFLIILGVLVLLLVVGGGAYYLGTQKNQITTNTQNANLQSQTESTPIPTTQTQPTQTNSISTPAPKNDTKVGWKSYTDASYGYTIQYPTGWTLKQEKDSEGDARIKLTGTNATKAVFSSLRMLPELYITVTSPYSTSGTVCANQSCTETNSPLEVKIKDQYVVIPITKGEVIQGNDKQFDFYAFSFPLPGKKVTLQSYSEPVALNAIASYRTTEEGQIISNILSTLTY